MALINNWKKLTNETPKNLVNAMQQLHHAAQCVAAFGNSLIPQASDDSQSSLNWLPDIKALASQEVNLKRRVRLALIYNKFELQMINENESTMGVFPLSGQTKSTALSFVRTQARAMGVSGEDVQPIDHYQLPEHDLNKGAPFLMTSPDDHRELAKYRHNASLIIGEIAKMYEYASPVATWPHHFDTASTITVKFDDTSNQEKTVGIGFSPADGLCDEPYFYVNHWTKKEKISYDTLPSLPEGGTWETSTDWKGAILKASAIVKLKEATAQYELTDQFLKSGIEASLEILEETAVKA
ncbi:MAG: hypothetical protein RIC19_15275 [Phaeodactylibacter sp.]|uniref:hypothetical protein n=1 Tax=Phaeodactylibacter sp. TaxID=1940289 RepID=UPI0032EFBBB9